MEKKLLITKKMIREAARIGLITITDSPNDDKAVCCLVSDEHDKNIWFYLDSIKAKNTSAAKYKKVMTEHDIIEDIYNTFAIMISGWDTTAIEDYFRCLEIFNDNLPNSEPIRNKIKIPGGWLIIEEKGSFNDNPGVVVSFSKEWKNTPDLEDAIFSARYDSRSGSVVTATC